MSRYEPETWEELFWNLYYDMEKAIDNNWHSPDWKFVKYGEARGKAWEGAMFLQHKEKPADKIVLNEEAESFP